jgi:glycosyltransferase involved in cell wall biosynthesis
MSAHRLVSIVIPTFKRPFSFVRAARSAFAQRGYGMAAELIAIDNDADGSAIPVLQAIAHEAPFPFTWAQERRAGVANARNAALALARGDLIAFLDDDEEAETDWLANLIRTQSETGADAVFGPVEAVLPDEIVRHRTYFETHWSRRRDGPSGLIDRYYGMGNSLLVRQRLLSGPAPFDAEANERGGEDDFLFSRAMAQGATYAWAADARVKEHVPAHRARLAYTLRRAFAFGQGPCETAWMQRPKDYAAIMRHMAIGAGQLGVYGLGAAAAWLMRGPQRVPLADRAISGAGKLLWFFPQRFYGSAAPGAKPKLKPPTARVRPGVPLV